jgi:hypothetical protein
MIVLAGALALAPAARAERQAWSLEVEGGVRYDSNVAVDETDLTSSIGDIAATLALEAGYKLVDGENSRLEIGYDFSQSLYQDVDYLNYQSHNPEVNAWTKLGGVKLGLNYGYTNALLDDSFFLEQHSIVPSISGFLSEDLLVTMSFRYTNKNFNRLDDGRDAQIQQPNVELMYYFDKPKRGYFSIGGGFSNEDTTDPAFDFSGATGRAALQIPVDLAGLDARIKFSYMYQIRDYDDVTSTPSGALREDDRHTLRARGELDITGDLTAIADFRFIDRNSNLATADYSENIASGSLRYDF